MSETYRTFRNKKEEEFFMNKKFEKLGFYPADILLPKDQDMRKWGCGGL